MFYDMMWSMRRLLPAPAPASAPPPPPPPRGGARPGKPWGPQKSQ